MELRKLTDEQLEKSFHHVVKSERKIIHLVILHIQEIHRRKLYLAPAYGSLAQYLIKVFKYSGAAAQRRIEAARLMNDVPEVAAKLESGELNLSQVCDLQKAVKESEKIHQTKVTKEAKANLVHQVLNQNSSQTQQLCAKLLDIPVQESQKIKTQKDKSKRIETTFTEEQYAKFEKVRDLLAHKNFQRKRTQNINDVLETMFDEILSKHFKVTKVDRQNVPSAERVTQSKNMNSEFETASEVHRNTASVTECETAPELLASVTTTGAAKLGDSCDGEVKVTGVTEGEMPGGAKAVGKKKTKESVISRSSSKSPQVNLRVKWNTITPKRHRIILAEDKCCQYTNYETGEICGSTFNLQVDHITPKHAGGTNDPSNLRVLCREHNLFRNQKVKRNYSLNLN